jgi:hypothetical protein
MSSRWMCRVSSRVSIFRNPLCRRLGSLQCNQRPRLVFSRILKRRHVVFRNIRTTVSFPPSSSSQFFLSKMHRLSTTLSRSLRCAAAKAAKPALTRGAHNETKFSNQGRASILKGVGVLANAVSLTLGPKGEFGSVRESSENGRF